MKRKRSLSILLCSCLFLAACSTSTPDSIKVVENKAVFSREEPVSVDNTRSSISFVGSNSLVRHEGKFEQFEVDIVLDEQEPRNLEKGRINVTIYINSIITGSNGLNEHLLSDDFFDVEKYPTALFSSQKITKVDALTYAITGDMTIKDKTTSITFDAVITNDYARFEYDLNRLDFGVGEEENGPKRINPIVPLSAKTCF